VPISDSATRSLAAPQTGALPRVTVAMLGARMHYAVPRLLYEAGLLERFFTDSYIGNKPWLESILRSVPERRAPRGLLQWLGRKDAVLPANKVSSSEALGLWYVWARQRAKTYVAMDAVFREVARRFSAVILRAGLGEAPIIWGFNNASLELFQSARAQGRQCILEQTILPPELEIKLMREELARWPGWQPSLDIPEFEHSAVDRAEQEWVLADCIVTGSDFVRDGLERCGVPRGKIRVVPYGLDVNRFLATERRERDRSAALRVLCVGEVGLRKGVPDLLHALAQLGPASVEARFAGEVALELKRLDPFDHVATFLGRVPRVQMPELYRWADVFVLPSIVEGSATATYEALLSGLPVVTTLNAGSIVRSGIDGFIVPIRDAHALAETIGRYASDRELLAQHQAATLQRRERAGLDRYKADLVNVIRDISMSEGYRNHNSSQFR
jgi:glycosyltransferase involved in cell wall biosynthesis